MSTSDRNRYEIRHAVNNGSRVTASQHGARWTQRELDYLNANYTHATAEAVATALGRTVEACKQAFYIKPDRTQDTRHQEKRTTQTKTPGQLRWEQGFTDLSHLDW